jgi:hypothetical protein
MSRVVPYSKEVVVCWQPAAARGSWLFAGDLKHIFSHWLRDGDEIRLALFKVAMIVRAGSLGKIFAVPNLNVFVGFNGQE